MDRCRLAVVVQALAAASVCAGGFIVARLTADDRPRSWAADERVAELVEQLGSAQYVVRRRAEEALIDRGIEAFDALKAAEHHPDVEVAARAAYLTQLIEIPWIQDDAPEDVKTILRGYGDLVPEERASQIRALATLPNQVGLAPLCRIARFESSPLLSRAAALAVVQTVTAGSEPAAWGSDRLPQLADIVAAHVGHSTRPAARWIRALLIAQRDTQAGLARWQELVTEEQRRLVEHPDESRVQFVVALQRQQVALLRIVGRRDEAVALTIKMVELEPDESETLVDLLQWLAKEHAWTDVDRVAQQFADRFASQVRLRYALAQARSAQGMTERAEALAEQAFQMHAGNAEQHLATAIDLERSGLFSWAEREYRYVIELNQPTSEALLWAGNRLALMLHDHGQPLQAARVLQVTVERIDQALTKRRTQPDQHPDRPRRVRDPLRARVEYYRAAHYGQQEDWAAQRQHLELAIQYDLLDADVLIAMYRLPTAEPTYHRKICDRIAQAVATYRQQIERSPSDAAAFNQLAWLVANTEGDFDEALAASQSLKLVPDSAGYLDTLAHCYYAKRDYQRAVQVQSQAARLEPHTQSILRQLRVFRAALQESRTAHQE